MDQVTGRLEKPRQNWAGLWNISFGFFGIQIGFALQNANMSRVFQSLGASLDDLPALWVAAPLTGLLVQPIVGFMSDRTWVGGLGRRRPYFVAGALLAALSLMMMPLAPVLLVAAGLLWMLDASLNISMEPFRAFVGDQLRKDQHTAGYAVQTAFIGAGAVVGSIFPYLLEHWGVSNVGPGIPDTVKWSFWAGGAALFLAVMWTVFTTREYSPDEMRRFGEEAEVDEGVTVRALAARSYASSYFWAASGAAVIISVAEFGLEKEVYLLGALLIAYGALSVIAIAFAKRGRRAGMLGSLVGDFSGMPPVMKQLAVVQFFSWSALFVMWIYSGPVVAQYFFGSADADSAAYQAGSNWWGVLYASQNGFATLAALLLLPLLAKRIGKAATHRIGLTCGALGFASFFVLPDENWLFLSQLLCGIAWASILAMPYAILASALPQAKLGTYMGLFNIFIVVPQLLVATVMGSIMKALFPGEPIWTMAFAAGVMALAALATLRVREA